MVDGGLRDRFIAESVFEHINNELTAKNWFALDASHTPLTVVYSFPEDTDPVQKNTLAMSTGNADTAYVELGSLAFAKGIMLFFDFYAENDPIGQQLIGDIEHFLMKNPSLDVYDYENAKAVLFQAQVEDAYVRRPVRVTQPWQKHWITLSVEIEDELR